MLNEISNIYVTRPQVSSKPVDFIRQYQQLLNVNSCGYLIEIGTNNVISLNDKESQVLGIRGFSFRNFDSLFDHIDTSHIEPHMAHSLKYISVYFNNIHSPNPNDVNATLYRSKSGKVLYRSTGPLCSKEGKVILTYGIIQDVTGLVDGYHFKKKISGPNEDYLKKLYFGFHDKEMLTKREVEVLGFIKRGYTSKRIAYNLHISKLTVDTHRKNILRKLRAGNIYEAIDIYYDVFYSSR